MGCLFGLWSWFGNFNACTDAIDTWSIDGKVSRDSIALADNTACERLGPSMVLILILLQHILPCRLQMRRCSARCIYANTDFP